MKMTKTMWWMIGGAGVAGLGIGAYFFLKRNKNKKANNVSFSVSQNPTAPKKIVKGGNATAVEEPNWLAPFDMNYINDVKKWLSGKSIKELPMITAKKYALELKNAKGLIDDDEAAVELVFKRLQDKTQVAVLSRAFYIDHKQDMYKYLIGFLSDGEMKELILDPIRKLPNYRLG